MFKRALLLVLFMVSVPASAQTLQAVQVYSDNELLELIKENKHLCRLG
jgi:hypothetical protein